MTEPTLAEWLLEQIADDESRYGDSRTVPNPSEQIVCPCGEKGFLTSWGSRLEISHSRGWVPPEIRAGWVMGDGHSITQTHVLEGAEAAAVRAAWPLAESSARVLAECEARRRIIEIHADGRAELRYPGDDLDDEFAGMPAWCVRCEVDHQGERWPCETLRLLAAPYADRPGFREEWRP